MKSQLDELERLYPETEEGKVQMKKDLQEAIMNEDINKASKILEDFMSLQQGYDFQDAIDAVMLIIFAGHETTATSFLAALFALKRKPEVQAKLMEAVDTCRDENGKLDMEKIHQLDYLKAFVWEVLRMYPPVTQSPRNYNGKIRKYDVEKKVFVESEETISILFDIKDINRDPKKFKNPNDFDPDNFLNDDGTFNKELADELLTFYFGPQGCPGQRFSEEELTVLTAELLARYEIVHEPGPIEPEVLSQATEKPKNNKHTLIVRKDAFEMLEG